MRHFYEFGEFRVDAVKRLLLKNGEPIPLTPKVFETLFVLVQNGGRILEKNELMNLIWGDTAVEENNLAQNIFTLRKAFDEKPNQHRFIVTIPGRGYQFVPDVKEFSDGRVDPENEERARLAEENPEEEKAAEITENHSSPPDRAATAPRRQLSKFFIIFAVLLCFAGVGGYFWRIRENPRGANIETQEIKTIAVLPFKSLISENADESLEIGIADALITKLGSAKQIVVRPTSAIIKYSASAEQDALVIGRQLKVDAVLDGKIQKAGDKIRVTAQLLRVADGSSLWAGTFDEKYTDIFRVQDSISEQIAKTLALKLDAAERKLLVKRDTDNVEAYEAYLKGRYFWNKRTEEGLKKSVEFFEQAIRLDSGYASAYAGMSNSYALLGFYNYLSPNEAWTKSKTAATQALKLDDSLAEAHAALALVKDDYELDWAGAEEQYRRAIELNPNYPTVRQWYAWHLLGVGRNEEALAQLKRAQELDPTSLSINTAVATFYYFTEDYDRAIEQSRQTLETDSNFVRAHLTLGLAYEQKGMFQEAISEFQKARELSDDSTESLSALGHAFAKWGKLDEARKILGELSKMSEDRFVSPSDPAIIHIGLKNFDKARELLNKGTTERSTWWVRLRLDPRLKVISSSAI